MQQLKVLSDLLVSVSKVERQEARMKIRQESLRLGNVSIIRLASNITFLEDFFHHMHNGINQSGQFLLELGFLQEI